MLVLLFLGSNLFGYAANEITASTVKVRMPDGIELLTDLYLPDTEKKLSVILIRTPYNSKQLVSIGKKFASAEYAVVVQNVRGMSGSGGQFIPFVNEQKDGIETLNWISEQSWSNGRVGIWGESYLAYAGLVLTPTNHPNYKTMVNISGMADIEHFFFPGGAFHLMAQFPWFYLNMQRNKFPTPEVWDKLFRTTPEKDLFGGNVELMDMFKGIEGQHDKVSVPIFHISGWYDFVFPETLKAYSGIEKHGSVFQKIIVGPWYHDQVFMGKSVVGDLDFGPAARRDFDELLDLSIRWFDRYLKGIDNGIEKEPRVSLFVMGKNEWRNFTKWPMGDGKTQKWYLSSKAGANSSEGDGTLSLQEAKSPGTDQFVFDPLDPVPTLGGDNFHYFRDNVGIKNQAEIEKRKDVLVYTSKPLADGLEIIGPVKLVLYASTEGADTDFTGKLVELRKDGYARLIQEGIVRAQYRESRRKPMMLKPGKVYRFEINIGATAINLHPGSRLRLEVSSSNFPKYDRNPNTGEDAFEATNLKEVKQTIYFSGEHPSHIVLPVR